MMELKPNTCQSDSYLCGRCAAIDFKTIFSLDASTLDEQGAGLLDLSPLSHSNDCELCQIFFTLVQSSDLRIRPGWDQPEPAWHLRAFSCLSQVCVPYTEQWKERRPATVLSLVEGTTSQPFLERDTGWYSPSILPVVNCATDATFHFHGRELGEYVDFNYFKTRIARCEQDHASCRTLLKAHPRRLLRCKDRLVVVNNNYRYAALSYVWGSSAQHTISLQDMPRTIEDAIRAALKLGIDYLWTDRFCINQLSSDDFHHEIQAMAGIYANAAVTLVSLGSGAETGLPGVLIGRSQTTLRTKGLQIAPMLPGLGAHVRKSEWASRGWTYQEYFLSTRCLFFTPQEAILLCSSTITHESRCQEAPDDVPITGNMTGHGLRSSIFKLQWKAPITEEHEIYDPDFVIQLQEYSQRKLTFQEDGLNAFQGILSTLNSPNHYGITIWECNMPMSYQLEVGFIYGLMWYSKSCVKKRNFFPSWSWVSTPAEIRYFSSQMMFDARLLRFTAKTWIEDEGCRQLIATFFHRIMLGKAAREHARTLSIESYTTIWNVEAGKFISIAIEDATTYYDLQLPSVEVAPSETEENQSEYLEALLMLAYDDRARWILLTPFHDKKIRVGVLESFHQPGYLDDLLKKCKHVMISVA